MPKYIIERKVPGIGLGSPEQLQAIAQKSNEALHQLNGEVLWLESFMTDDSSFCVYVAPNEELVKRHAELSGFPADRVIKVDTVIDPSTGESSMPLKMSSGKAATSEKITRQ